MGLVVLVFNILDPQYSFILARTWISPAESRVSLNQSTASRHDECVCVTLSQWTFQVSFIIRSIRHRDLWNCNQRKIHCIFLWNLQIIEVFANEFPVFRIYSIFGDVRKPNQFSILLDCLIQEQSYLRPIVFDPVCLIRSNLICRHLAPVRCWWQQTHVCWWTQILDTTTVPHMYSKFIDVWNMQICGGCAEHPSLEWPWILYHLLFGFGSVEIAQKDMCCVQVIEPHTYVKFNHASNVQMCIVCSDCSFI